MPPPLRSAHIYAAEGKSVIIAPLHFNSAGIRYEQDVPIVVENSSWEAVVPHLRISLERFSFRRSESSRGEIDGLAKLSRIRNAIRSPVSEWLPLHPDHGC